MSDQANHIELIIIYHQLILRDGQEIEKFLILTNQLWKNIALPIKAIHLTIRGW